jgi:hypothetical protein
MLLPWFGRNEFKEGVNAAAAPRHDSRKTRRENILFKRLAGALKSEFAESGEQI